VLQVRINPTTVQNVVTYDAVVTVHDTSGRLLPGMTAQVTIEVGKQTHVLAVPIAAVLYRPLAAPTAAVASPGGGFGGGGFGAGVVQSSGGAAAQPVAGAPGSKITIWKLVAGRPVPVQVVIGLSDGKNLEITSGGVQEGDLIIVAQRRGGGSGSSTRSGSGGGTGSAGRSGTRGSASGQQSASRGNAPGQSS
jgi:HlyD family secretion protein